MFIVVKKISTYYKKDNENKRIPDPSSRGGKTKFLVEKVKIVEETIRLSEIKSSREYHRSSLYEEHGIKGKVTAVYLFGQKRNDIKSPEMHIHENIDSWNKRLGAIALNEVS